MAGKKKGFNLDGSVDKRYGKKKAVAPQPVAVVPESVPESVPQTAGSVSYIDEIIESRQAPGVHIAPEHQSAQSKAKAEERRLAIYKENTKGKDPKEPMCHDQRTQTGGHL